MKKKLETALLLALISIAGWLAYEFVPATRLAACDTSQSYLTQGTHYDCAPRKADETLLAGKP